MKLKSSIKIFFLTLLTVNIVFLEGSETFSYSQDKKQEENYCSPTTCCPPQRACYERPRGENIVIISPVRGENFLNTRPTFSWYDGPKNQKYRITLKSNKEPIPIWDTEIVGTTVTYPQNRNQLTDGSYTLIIKHQQNRKEINFHILNKKEIEEIKKEINALNQKYSNPTTDIQQKETKIMAIAKLYEEYNLITQARETLEEAIKNNLKTSSIYQQLGELYQNNIYAHVEAEKAYEQALKIVRKINNKKTEADIHFELGYVNRSLGNWEKAINHVRKAHTIYQNIDEPFLVGQTEQFMAEVYFKCKKKTESIQWYQQAKETYQKLGKRQYQEAIEAKMQKL